MKKLVIVLMMVLLTLALVAAPATAKGKKKKGPKPYRSEDVTVLVAHPVFFNTSGTILGVTAQEFMQDCSIPSSNGLDAYVFEVPEQYIGIEAAVRAVGNATGPASYDLDMFMFDEACNIQVTFQAVGTDEAGVKFKDTAYVLVMNYIGDPNQSLHLEMALAP